jgi:formimidoylglutamate deiminase
MTTLYRPSLLYDAGAFQSGASLLADREGKIESRNGGAGTLGGAPENVVELRGRALLPGFVNAHSHCFQRLIRGKSESRAGSGEDFWSWRNTMYRAAASLSAQDVYDVARMTFVEMVRAGITTVGEFHYLHAAPDGRPYEDANLLSHQIISAAKSVGIRMVLLRCAYLRSGYELPADPGQRRFLETVSDFCRNTEALIRSYENDRDAVHIGVAPHSTRAVPLHALHEIMGWARAKHLPVHMHISEQMAENEACLREHGTTPLALLCREGLLEREFAAVHAIHITEDEISMLGDAGCIICACPTTERNLGDGILAADKVMQAGVPVALGSDSQAQIDPLEDARELDYHLRLQHRQRAVLDRQEGISLSRKLFDCATQNGARSLGLDTGSLVAGSNADFITVDLNDLSIAGYSGDDLLPALVFGLNRSAVKDVFVGGRQILFDGKHPLEDEIVARYLEVHGKVWSSGCDSGKSR